MQSSLILLPVILLCLNAINASSSRWNESSQSKKSAKKSSNQRKNRRPSSRLAHDMKILENLLKRNDQLSESEEETLTSNTFNSRNRSKGQSFSHFRMSNNNRLQEDYYEDGKHSQDYEDEDYFFGGSEEGYVGNNRTHETHEDYYSFSKDERVHHDQIHNSFSSSGSAENAYEYSPKRIPQTPTKNRTKSHNDRGQDDTPPSSNFEPRSFKLDDKRIKEILFEELSRTRPTGVNGEKTISTLMPNPKASTLKVCPLPKNGNNTSKQHTKQPKNTKNSTSLKPIKRKKLSNKSKEQHKLFTKKPLEK